MIYLYIALGGAFGACLRFFLMQIMVTMLGRGFPFGTLLVNILGSFSIGVIFMLVEKEVIASVPLRSFLMVGVLGALTTFSTFSLDNLLLLQQGHVAKALLNIFLNVAVCLAVAYVGMQVVNLRH